MEKSLSFIPKTSFWFYSLFILNVVFPKAGFKIGSIPITFGYILLGIYSLIFLPRSFKEAKKPNILCAMAWAPFQILCIVQFFVSPPIDMGYFYSFTIHFIFFPFIFYLVLHECFTILDEEKFIKIIKNSMLFLAIFGIFSFFYKFFTDSFIEIPGLTTNFSDVGTLEEEKFIDRGGIYKLISTYNNGNLFGICQLFFYPLLLNQEKSNLKKTIIRSALILTLSRTIWIGLILAELIEYLRGKSLKILLTTVLLILAIYQIDCFLTELSNQGGFLLDSNLGGRAEQLATLNHLSLFGIGGFDGIYEMVYIGILQHFGIVGFFLFIIGFSFPIILLLFSSKKSNLSSGLTKGILLYAIISLSDGAILLIPVLFIYFMLCSILLTRSNLRINTPISSY